MELVIKLWPVYVALFLLAIAKLLFETFGKKLPQTAKAEYQRKQYLFDSNSEFALFAMLLELFGNQYHIFPQIHYSHLLEPKASDWKHKQSLRSRIDRKSADFVLCDRQTAVPVLVVELDGPSHTLEKQQTRDTFIDEVLAGAGLPIVHLTTEMADKEQVRQAIQSKLNVSKTRYF